MQVHKREANNRQQNDHNQPSLLCNILDMMRILWNRIFAHTLYHMCDMYASAIALQTQNR